MSKADSNHDGWRADLARLLEGLSERDLTGSGALRLALAELWLILRSVPDDVAIAYRKLPETAILEAADRLGYSLSAGRLDRTEAATDSEIALVVGGQLRALERELLGRPGFAHPPAGPNSLLVPEIDAFIVPKRDSKTHDGRTGPGRGFGRRGTPHHRILPRLIDGYEIRLVWDPRLSAGRTAGTRRTLGAALLPGMELTRDPDWETWLALSAECPDHEAIVSAQVDGSYDGGVMAVVYPELSMPPGRLAALRAALERRSRLMEPGRGPAVVAAGSWHEEDADGMRNVMRVLDKTGGRCC